MRWEVVLTASGTRAMRPLAHTRVMVVDHAPSWRLAYRVAQRANPGFTAVMGRKLA